MYNETSTETVLPPVAYDESAYLVINENPSYYGEVKAVSMSAKELSMSVRNSKIYGERNDKHLKNIASVETYLKEWYEELGDHADEIAALLEIDLVNEVEVTFDVTITAVIRIPLKSSVDDLSEYDFDVTIQSNESDYDIETYDVNINEIS